jgi:hypothetical protein
VAGDPRDDLATRSAVVSGLSASSGDAEACTVPAITAACCARSSHVQTSRTWAAVRNGSWFVRNVSSTQLTCAQSESRARAHARTHAGARAGA